ncbi:MAG TPA: hypothetical protein VGF59_00055 [Bryobacteraceae bacterium]|jgi:hypothetical protein
MGEAEAMPYRVRATMADGAERLAGPFASIGDAAGYGRRLLASGAADRVEMLVRRDGRWHVVGVVGRPKRLRPANEPEEW